MAQDPPDRWTLPEKAIWIREGTDPVADAKWLAAMQPTPRHFRLYRIESPYMLPQPRDPGEEDCLDLLGVVVINADDIEQSTGGLLLPSPSMLGHIDARMAAAAKWDSRPVKPRDPAAPLKGCRSTAHCLDAFAFDPRVGYRLEGSRINETQMEWLAVRRLGAITRCAACNKVLPTRYCAVHCQYCGTMCYSLWTPP